jgi:hypothetical protein
MANRVCDLSASQNMHLVVLDLSQIRFEKVRLLDGLLGTCELITDHAYRDCSNQRQNKQSNHSRHGHLLPFAPRSRRGYSIPTDPPRATLQRSIGLLDRSDEDFRARLEIALIPLRSLCGARCARTAVAGAAAL